MYECNGSFPRLSSIYKNRFYDLRKLGHINENNAIYHTMYSLVDHHINT